MEFTDLILSLIVPFIFKKVVDGHSQVFNGVFCILFRVRHLLDILV